MSPHRDVSRVNSTLLDIYLWTGIGTKRKTRKKATVLLSIYQDCIVSILKMQ